MTGRTECFIEAVARRIVTTGMNEIRGTAFGPSFIYLFIYFYILLYIYLFLYIFISIYLYIFIDLYIFNKYI